MAERVLGCTSRGNELACVMAGLQTDGLFKPDDERSLPRQKIAQICTRRTEIRGR